MVLSDGELADEVRRRRKINQHWVNTYWEEFIPYAHGIRLFGQYYNDAVRPDDPYEFMNLLTQTQMARNCWIFHAAAIAFVTTIIFIWEKLRHSCYGR